MKSFAKRFVSMIFYGGSAAYVLYCNNGVCGTDYSDNAWRYELRRKDHRAGQPAYSARCSRNGKSSAATVHSMQI